MSTWKGVRAPKLNEKFTIRDLEEEEAPEKWYHVYCTKTYPATTANTFNQGWGNTRFAPIKLPDGTFAHTYYVASTRQCAYMESILHDISLAPPGVLEIESLGHFHLATLELNPSVKYVSFHSKDLPGLKLSRARLIDSLSAQYEFTRPWAQAAIAQRPVAQAIGYGSRRDDAARCLMLVGQRLPTPPFNLSVDVERLDVEPRRSEVLDFASSLGIRLI